jgi:hypothetical protein
LKDHFADVDLGDLDDDTLRFLSPRRIDDDAPDPGCGAVTDLDQARIRRQFGDVLVCTCGAGWWKVAVSLDANGVITGNTVGATCYECGQAAPVMSVSLSSRLS